MHHTTSHPEIQDIWTWLIEYNPWLTKIFWNPSALSGARASQCLRTSSRPHELTTGRSGTAKSLRILYGIWQTGAWKIPSQLMNCPHNLLYTILIKTSHPNTSNNNWGNKKGVRDSEELFRLNCVMSKHMTDIISLNLRSQDFLFVLTNSYTVTCWKVHLCRSWEIPRCIFEFSCRLKNIYIYLKGNASISTATHFETFLRSFLNMLTRNWRWEHWSYSLLLYVRVYYPGFNSE